MDAHDVDWLRSDEGARALARAAEALAGGSTELAVLERLRRDLDPARARAVLALIEGRRSAAGKFADAERLFFDRESAEQATAEAVARHTAARFAGVRRIADLGCGAGGDALALAAHAPVLAVDRDPARLALVVANAAVRGLPIEVAEAGVEAFALPDDIDAAWLDPARRDEGGRVRDPEQWSPPLSVALRIASTVPRAGIKVAPGIDLAAIPAACEVEFISHAGTLVEAVLWSGAAVTARRRATVVEADRAATVSGDADTGATPLAEPGTYLYDLDPAVGRAGLVDAVAPSLHAWRLDERTAYVSGDEAVDSPFARRFRIDAWLPFSERALRQALADLGVTRVEVMRRASPVDTNALEVRLNRALSSADRAARVRTVALTRVREAHVAIVCERER
ncbi:MAG: methyltransferase domain-containing protein [Dehalococcoidia bacterium]